MGGPLKYEMSEGEAYMIHVEQASQADADRIAKGKSFFDTLGAASKVCYRRTPLLDQDWKSDLFLGAAGVTIVAFGLGKLQRRR